MKATAFAPGHISCFFEPIYHKNDVNRTGSRGAGINITLGAISEVSIGNSTKQNIEIFINNKKSPAPATDLALKYLLGDNNLNVIVKTQLGLPMGQGFGMSATGALSATLALTKITNVSQTQALKAAHFAEVKLKTGLGDVMASSFGGIEIRKTAGLPPWGVIEHIHGEFDLVLCVIGKKLETKKILNDPKSSAKIVDYGKYCTKKILENPSVENLFLLSKLFTNKTNLAEKNVIIAIQEANKYGSASMCMLGNSIFAMGKTNDLCKVLMNHGKVFVCNVDQAGARILE